MAHVDRLFKKNVNAFDEHTKNNFGSDFKLYDRYKELHKQRNEIRKARSDSTTFIDANLIFSLEQWEHLEKNYSTEKLQIGMKKMMDLYLIEMKNQFGLEPVGYKFHLDEGHNKNELIRNIHAHVLFYNFDFDKKISPWRKITRKETSLMQDIAAACFKKAGFERGISKEITKKTGLDKDQFVVEKQKEQQAVIDNNNKIIQIQKDEQESLKMENNKLLDSIVALKSQNKALKEQIKKLFDKYRLGMSKFILNLVKRDSDDIKKDIEYLSGVVVETLPVDQELANEMTDNANELSKRLGSKEKINLKKK
jgi:hypothetical protein